MQTLSQVRYAKPAFPDDLVAHEQVVSHPDIHSPPPPALVSVVHVCAPVHMEHPFATTRFVPEPQLPKVPHDS